MNRTLVSVLSACLLLNCAMYAGDKANKPVRTLHILFVAPESFDALWKEAELIAHVRIIGNRPEATTDGRFVHTAHRARVIDVLKSDVSADCAAQARDVKSCSPLAGQELRFMQKAGEVETADAVISLADEVPLKPGTEYILFLRWDAHLKEFLPFHGPDGTFEIHDGTLRPTGHSQVAKEQSGKSSAKFKDELRRKGGKP